MMIMIMVVVLVIMVVTVMFIVIMIMVMMVEQSGFQDERQTKKDQKPVNHHIQPVAEHGRDPL